MSHSRRKPVVLSDTAGASTRVVHAGTRRPEPDHSIATPIVSTATYAFADTAEIIAHMTGAHPDGEREEYGRYGNPTVRSLEERIGALEDRSGTADAAAFSTGMAALTTSILALVRAGSHVILFRDGYRRTRQFVAKTLAAFGVEHSVVEPGDLDGVARAIRKETKLIVGETPTNPYLVCTDVQALAKLAKQHRIKTIVDATFATPVLLRPLELGADLVVHSATKYLAGHHDVLAGVVAGPSHLVGLVRDLRGVLGSVLDPQAAFLVSRGLKTLALRVHKSSATAMRLASLLAEHPRVSHVYYPGLPSHPTHAIAKAQMSAFGGVVSFRVQTPDGEGAESALSTTSRVIDAFKLARIAPSLGGADTLVEQPAVMSFYEMSRQERRAVGIEDDLIRLAVGIEDDNDVIADVMQALAAS